jgi:deoxyribodipyrimidine photolyase-related protein
MVTGRDWHKERLFFLISSARHFAKELESSGYAVEYLKAENTVAGLSDITGRYPGVPVYCASPSSYRLTKSLEEFGVEFVDNDFFLTSRDLFQQWASAQKSFVMENFYRAQRKRLNILIQDGEPVGGRWNFDSENRLPPPKNYAWPPYLEHKRDELDLEIANEIDHTPTSTWATTRQGALDQLKNFVTNHLVNFGPYEDAISAENWALHHSLLSPYLNNGLLLPEEVIDRVLEKYVQGHAPIQSVEAFVRQVIGWREYINGMYWYLGEDYRNKNELGAQLPLPLLFNDSTKTQMNCVRAVISDVEQRSWTHHIPRLMVLSNLALLTGVNPQQFLDWMREQFIDATDWVMVPNVIGMAVHADGGTLMTKPYAAGGAYLNRMTQHCKSCVYDPKKRVGDDACPFTTLYWDFLDRHKEQFIKNHRMFQQINGLKRLSDLPELKIRAKEVIEGISAGVV